MPTKNELGRNPGGTTKYGSEGLLDVGEAGVLVAVSLTSGLGDSFDCVNCEEETTYIQQSANEHNLGLARERKVNFNSLSHKRLS